MEEWLLRGDRKRGVQGGLIAGVEGEALPGLSPI